MEAQLKAFAAPDAPAEILDQFLERTWFAAAKALGPARVANELLPCLIGKVVATVTAFSNEAEYAFLRRVPSILEPTFALAGGAAALPLIFDCARRLLELEDVTVKDEALAATRSVVANCLAHHQVEEVVNLFNQFLEDDNPQSLSLCISLTPQLIACPAINAKGALPIVTAYLDGVKSHRFTHRVEVICVAPEALKSLLKRHKAAPEPSWTQMINKLVDLMKVGLSPEELECVRIQKARANARMWVMLPPTMATQRAALEADQVRLARDPAWAVRLALLKQLRLEGALAALPRVANFAIDMLDDKEIDMCVGCLEILCGVILEVPSGPGILKDDANFLPKLKGALLKICSESSVEVKQMTATCLIPMASAFGSKNSIHFFFAPALRLVRDANASVRIAMLETMIPSSYRIEAPQFPTKRPKLSFEMLENSNAIDVVRTQFLRGINTDGSGASVVGVGESLMSREEHDWRVRRDAILAVIAVELSTRGGKSFSSLDVKSKQKTIAYRQRLAAFVNEVALSSLSDPVDQVRTAGAYAVGILASASPPNWVDSQLLAVAKELQSSKNYLDRMTVIKLLKECLMQWCWVPDGWLTESWRAFITAVATAAVQDKVVNIRLLFVLQLTQLLTEVTSALDTKPAETVPTALEAGLRTPAVVAALHARRPALFQSLVELLRPIANLIVTALSEDSQCNVQTAARNFAQAWTLLLKKHN